ncbi:MAG: polysulfide reductase NrfD [Syntrophaceae bacterium]|nr:polysulfide reductase NrfD [Syntrophaceae bacterium]
MSLASKPSTKTLKRIRPQREWRWEIAIYLYLAGMGAGSFIVGLFTHWNGFGLSLPLRTFTFWGVPLELSKLALLWGPILVAIGAPFLILDLGKKLRFYTACFNPRTSWLARGFFILSGFILAGLIVLGALSFQQMSHPPLLWRLFEIISMLLAFATAIYTGILLKSVRYIPIWNTPLLPALFLLSALSTGSMGVILSTMGYGLLFPGGGLPHLLISRLTRIEQILVLIEGLILATYLISKYRAKDQGEDSVRLLISGDLRFLFWGGIVAVGFLFPIVLEYLYSHFPQYPGLLFATGALLLAGGFFLRLGLLASGVKERLPMYKLIEMKIKMSAFQRGE